MLSNFTDEQLRSELKRRANERRKNAVRKPTEYLNLTGIVYHIDNIKQHRANGDVRYKPFSKWKFRLADTECADARVVNWAFHAYFKCALSKADAPKLGDKVVVQIRKVKQLMPSNVRNGKIVKIL
jgi:hypothetical protein